MCISNAPPFNFSPFFQVARLNEKPAIHGNLVLDEETASSASRGRVADLFRGPAGHEAKLTTMVSGRGTNIFTGRPLWFGTNSQFRAGMVVKLSLNRVLVPNHHGHPVESYDIRHVCF